MAVPQIPPRPTRSQLQHPSTTMSMEPPKVPPRPSHRLVERSISPQRDSFARSPLNEVPYSINHGNMSAPMYNNNDQNDSNSSFGLPNRPPSVSLPSIGQEGNEYGDIAYEQSENLLNEAGQTNSTQTRNVGSDLPLHAPKPSLSTSNAKARVATVTRTDSSQAAAAGIGKAATPSHDDKDPYTRALQYKTSFTRTESSASTERPASTLAESEQGIPEIGQRVPMYPNAGDVQAPSPSPFSQNFPSGIGFHNDGTQKTERHHGRTRSGREVFHGPPGSYGLHGHGVPNQDRFEKAWYEKHPDAIIREGTGQYGPGIGGGRGEWALSSEDLNKIVRDTASRGSGFGTSPNIVGLPNEQIGYMASEEYASRMNSPRPQSASYHKKAHSNHSQPIIESPLRKASFPVDTQGKDEFDMSKSSHLAGHRSSDNAVESETEDDDVVHVDAPDVRRSKYGGNGYDPPTEDLGPHGGNTEAEGGWIEETGYGTPILASDEVAKTPGLEYLQPAVSPVQERRGSAYYAGVDSDIALAYQSGHRNGSRSGSVSGSRSSSRPGSIHGSIPNFARFASLTSYDDREDMHTPLEDVEEYEPLFPDEEVKEGQPLSAADRFKHRPDMKRRFPSQDIWEDTPNSLQLQATVNTPEPAEGQASAAIQPSSTVFESPETEAARKGEVSEDEKAKLIPKEERWAKSHFQPHLREEIRRPGLRQRFPSRDIWEDSPDSARLETTVGDTQGEVMMRPPDEGIIAGAVVHTTGRLEEGKISGHQPRQSATAGTPAMEKPSVPSIPPRPVRTRHKEDNIESVPPSIPARPPQKMRQAPLVDLPSSPIRPGAESPPEEVRQVSPTEGRRVPILPDRPKPHIPARPTKPATRDSSEDLSLSRTISSTGSASDPSTVSKSISSPPPAPKPKPALPARPVGSKIASLKAGFMSDLDKRLQLGPQGPTKSQEPLVEDVKEEEKAPLADARKSRARGPQRRQPAASPAAVRTDETPKVIDARFSILEPQTMWHISTDGNGALDAEHAAQFNPEALIKDILPKRDEASTATLATNTDGESRKATTQNMVETKEGAQAGSHKQPIPVADPMSNSVDVLEERPAITVNTPPTPASDEKNEPSDMDRPIDESVGLISTSAPVQTDHTDEHLFDSDPVAEQPSKGVIREGDFTNEESSMAGNEAGSAETSTTITTAISTENKV